MRVGFLAGILLLGSLLACAGVGEAGGTARKADLQVMAGSKVRSDVAAAAIRIAGSGDSAALVKLGNLLARSEFLARLDDTASEQLKRNNLRRVLKEMEAHPSETTGRICESLAGDPNFLSDPDRKIFLLPALAEVRPTSLAAESIFRAANVEGYANFNGPLLVANGSPRALALFGDMVADTSVAAADRVDMLHKSVLAHRTSGPVVAACLRLLGRGLDPEVKVGLVETLFDYQERKWFGVARLAPAPPPWNKTESTVLQSYLKAAKSLREAGGLPKDLQAAMEKTVLEMRNILTLRGR